MSYRSILVHACDEAQASWRYSLAADLALAHEARLCGIAFSGLNELISNYGAACAMVPMGAQDFAFLTENAERERDAFLEQARHAGVALPQGDISDESAAYALPLAARYSDLLIVGQSHTPDAIAGGDHAVARSALIHAPCPVLLVPAGPRVAGLPQRVMVAWDGGMAASRALRAAMPLLRRASSVVAVCLPPQKHLRTGDSAGAALSAYLAGHGIAIEVIEAAPDGNTGLALLALAEQRGTDLLVMGSFGHSRFREIVLGGVTETVLREASMPVLMAH